MKITLWSKFQVALLVAWLGIVPPPAVAAGGDSRMRISARIYERPVDYPAVPATLEIDGVGIGQDFVVKVIVEDIRELAQRDGVFAGYVDLNFSAPELVSLVASLPGVNHPETGNPTPYLHNRAIFGSAARPLTGDGLIDTDMNGSLDQIDVLGSFVSTFDPQGGGEQVLVEFALTAQNPGFLALTPEPTSEDPALDPEDTGESPRFDNLLFGQDQPVCPSQSTLNACMGAIEFVEDAIFIGIEIFSDGFESAGANPG